MNTASLCRRLFPAGRRATQVALASHTGRVIAFKGTFGFLEYDREGAAAALGAGGSKAETAKTGAGDSAPDKATNGGPAGSDAPAGAAPDAAAAGSPPDSGATEKGGPAEKSSSKGLPRLYFHGSDVEGNVALRAGDEVRFTIASKPSRPGDSSAGDRDRDRGAGAKELIARRVLRTKVALCPD